MDVDKPGVVLLNPSPWTGFSLYKRKMLPLSLLYLAPPLEDLGYSVTIIDQFVDRSWRKKLNRALSKPPVCFGITSMTGPQLFQAVDICKEVREKYPSLPIVWGGVHVSSRPSQVLNSAFCDIAVIGEGEATFPELVEALRTGADFSRIKGIAYKEDGKHIFTGSRRFVDLNRYPVPAYHLVDMNQYSDLVLGVDHLHMICSRGCIYDCAYCWDPAFHKRKYRAMDPENVFGLMKHVVRAYGKNGFIFGDDNFFIDLEWARTILERIVSSDLDLHIGKLFIRADTLCGLDAGFLDLMAKAGVRRVVIGAESGSPRILRMIKKRITVEEILGANQKVKPYNIRPQFVFMMGLPTETPEDVGMSIRLAERLTQENSAATRSFNLYTPYPGTELYEMVVKMGFSEPETLEDWARYGYRNIPRETPWLRKETRKLVSILNYALMCNKHDGCLGTVKKADPLAVWLSWIYGPLARWRVRNLNAGFPFENFVIRILLWIFGRNRSLR